MKIHFADSRHPVTEDFKDQYTAEVDTFHTAAAKLLPFGSRHINFFVQPRTNNLIEGTGGNAHTHNSELIELAFDPEFKQASAERILSDVKFSVYHEMNHAARWNLGIWHNTFLDYCVMEGLANVFTRDHANEDAPWAKYPDNVTDWIQEITGKNDLFAWANYSFDHPDGGKWIAYKVGTYIVDTAIKNSNESAIELTKMKCGMILKLAKIDVGGYTGL